MNKLHTTGLELQSSTTRAPAVDQLPTTISIDQLPRGANDADVAAPARLTCVEVLAMAMLDSCAGG
ncbi:MAG: hypothetical protein P4L92_04105 [Rudaea sp.]|nr:hypothetical protein [Rudaea sp.]